MSFSTSDWDCWIAKEDGSDIIYLADEFQPNPIPEVKYPIRKSDHECIPGGDAPGDTVLQRLGWGAGRLKVILPVVFPAQLALLKALYFRYADGEHLGVQFHLPSGTLQCVWDSDLDSQRYVRGRERYRVEFELMLDETV